MANGKRFMAMNLASLREPSRDVRLTGSGSPARDGVRMCLAYVPAGCPKYGWRLPGTSRPGPRRSPAADSMRAVVAALRDACRQERSTQATGGAAYSQRFFLNTSSSIVPILSMTPSKMK